MQALSMTELKNKATELRIRVIDMIWKAQSGHPGGSLSVADFMTACYFRYMNVLFPLYERSSRRAPLARP